MAYTGKYYIYIYIDGFDIMNMILENFLNLYKYYFTVTSSGLLSIITKFPNSETRRSVHKTKIYTLNNGKFIESKKDDYKMLSVHGSCVCYNTLDKKFIEEEKFGQLPTEFESLFKYVKLDQVFN